MENFLNSAVIWFIIGLAFFLLEFVVPGFILFFFGIGAWIVAVLALFTDVSVNIQLMLFLFSSVITAVFFRNWVRTKLGMNQSGPQTLEDEFIGKTAIVQSGIAPGKNGKVEFKGASWEATSDYSIAAGERVIITNYRSIILHVKPIQSL